MGLSQNCARVAFSRPLCYDSAIAGVQVFLLRGADLSMRYAILADIHANLEALQAVLQELHGIAHRCGQPFDALWCLGDLVGYGPNPEECVELLRAQAEVVIAGNHDRAVAGMLPVEPFNDSAQVTAAWTRSRLSEEPLGYLAGLPERLVIGECTLVHGSPRNPVWEYLVSAEVAALSFPCFSTRFCVVGHTHLPTIFLQREELVPMGTSKIRQVGRHSQVRQAPSNGLLDLGPLDQLAGEQEALVQETFPLCEMLVPGEGSWTPPPGYRAIINPGSVGQPRDGDPRAAFMVYDTERGFEFYRVTYPVEQTQRKIWRSGLPARLAIRLGYGI